MTKKWAKKYDMCISCGKTTYKHHGRGLCRWCYLHTAEYKKYANQIGKLYYKKNKRRLYSLEKKRRLIQKRFKKSLWYRLAVWLYRIKPVFGRGN